MYFAVLLFLSAINSQAVEFRASALRGYKVQSCSSSVLLRDQSNAVGWGCLTYPGIVAVADFQSTENEIQLLKSKIDELEKRIQTLETKP